MAPRVPPLVEPVGRVPKLHVYDTGPLAAAPGATTQRTMSVDRAWALASEHPLAATPLIHRKGKGCKSARDSRVRANDGFQSPCALSVSLAGSGQ
eukprot:1860542-Pyramimonas_sp.AAC.2